MLGAAGLGFGYANDLWVYLTDVRNAKAVPGVATEVMPEGAPGPTVAGLTGGPARRRDPGGGDGGVSGS